MPKDERSNPRKVPVLALDDADDDVIDLLEVVKPGRNLKQDAGGDDGDFSADLDAMLDGLSEGEEEAGASDPAPFPDPTPVDYKVDHNETLDLPGMDDLDKLLKSFGPPGADSGKEETEEPDFLDTDQDMPDLDALPVPPVTSQAASSAAPAPAAPGGIEEAPPAEAAAKPAKKTVPAPEEDELLASLLATAAAAPPAAGKNDNAPPPPAGGANEDLFAELDLALDSPPPDGAPSLGDTLFAAADEAAPEPAPAEKQPASVEKQSDDADRSPPDADDGFPAGAGWSDLNDLDLDALGLEEEKPKAGPETFPATEPWPAEAPVETDPENIFDLALVDGGPEGRAMDVFVGQEQTAGVQAVTTEEAAAGGPHHLEDTSPGTASPETAFLDLDEEAAPDVQEDDPGPEVARFFSRDAAGGPDREDSVPALPETAVSQSRATASPDTGSKAGSPPHEIAGEEHSPVSRFDEVDLNELDALLDDMLATAPASGPSPAAAVAANGQAADTPADPKPADSVKAAASLDTDTAPAFPEVEAMQSRLAGQEEAVKDIRDQLAGQDAVLKEQRDMARALREDMDALSADVGRQQTRLTGHDDEIRELDRRLSELDDRITVSDQAAESGAPDAAHAKDAADSRLNEHGGETQEQAASRFTETVRQLEQRLSEHAEELQDLVQRFSGSCDLIQVVEQRLDSLSAKADAEAEDEPALEALAGKVELLEARLAERSARCDALEGRVEYLLANMDKLAAETAAKVIREELAALMDQ